MHTNQNYYVISSNICREIHSEAFKKIGQGKPLKYGGQWSKIEKIKIFKELTILILFGNAVTRGSVTNSGRPTYALSPHNFESTLDKFLSRQTSK